MWSHVTRDWRILPVALLGLLLVACPAKQSPALPAPPSPATGSPSLPAPSVSPSEPSSSKPEDPAELQGESSNAKKEDQGEAAAGQKGDSDEQGNESASTTGDGAETGQKPATGARASAAESRDASKPGGATTAGERSAKLEGKLAGSLRAFDEMLLKEQEELQRRRAEAGSELDPAGITTGAGSGSGAASSAGQGAHGSANPGGSSGATHAAGVGAAPAPKGVPDGSGDDVVARQIREAALKEKDPALRARLWVEYCDYKKSTGGKQCTLPVGETAAPEKKGEDDEG